MKRITLFRHRRSVILLVITALMIFAGSAGAGIIQVPGDYPKVQEAINAASSGDTVLVAAGRYAPSTNGESFAINMKNGVRLIGAGAAVCTLDAERTQRVMWCHAISDTFTRVEGFTITNGNTARSNGGGIWCTRSSALTIANNVVTGNSAYYDGGGIDCDHSSFQIIANNVITGNSATFGGGIGCVYASSPIITNNTITGNSAWYGGGIGCFYGSNATITNNVITGNSAWYGGGIYCHTSSPPITYNDVWGNAPQNYYGCGPGPGCISADPLFVDPAVDDYHLQPGSPCIDAGDNNAPGLQGFDFDGKPRILDGDGDGTAVVDMGAFEYGIPVIEAIVDFDPDKLNLKSKGKWVTCYIELPLPHSAEDIDPNTVALTKIDGTELDPPLYREGPTGVGDYDEDGITDLMVKFDRQALIAILKSMGYDAGDVVELTVAGELATGEAFEGSDVIEVLDKGKKDEPDEGGILSSGPLGGGGSSIEYTLLEASLVQIVIYDPLGRKVITLLEEYQDAGSHTVTWDGCNDSDEKLPSGVYLLRFKAGEFSQTARLVILR